MQNLDQKVLPMLQRQAFVKWWPRFDTTKAMGESVTIWFKNNPNFLQVADPETCKFLNQKARITVALATASSEDDFVENLQDVLKLVKQDKESKKGKNKQDLPFCSSSTSDSCSNEDDCYRIYSPINLTDD